MKCRRDWFNQVPSCPGCVILSEICNMFFPVPFLGISKKESPFSHHRLMACSGVSIYLWNWPKDYSSLHTSYAHKRPTLTGTYRALPCRHHHRDWDKVAADGSLSGKKFLVRLFIINTLILMSMVVAVQVHCLRCISLHSVRRLESWHDGAWTISGKASKKVGIF